MMELGLFISLKSVNHSDGTRKTGIVKTLLRELANNSKRKLRLDELNMVAFVIYFDTCKVLKEV